MDDHALEFLLAFDGRVHWFDAGYWIKFEIKQTAPSAERPHGLRYSFTLHDPQGRRLVGFDNAHAVGAPGRFKARPPETDHWHRTETDPGRSYRFSSADQLLADFFAEVRRVLNERGVDDTVVATTDKGDKP